MLGATQQSQREEVHLLFPDAELSKGLDSLWGENLVWSVDGFDRACTSANPDFQEPVEIFFGKQALLWLLPILSPESYKRKGTSKNHHNIICASILDSPRTVFPELPVF